jgi:hypothetical protein
MLAIFASLFPRGTDLLTLLEVIVALLVVWIIVSIPAYIAGKVVTRENATFGRAMLATLFGPVVYVIVLAVADFVLGGLLGTTGYALGVIVAFIAWIGVYKGMFKTGWLRAFAVAILALIVFVVMLLIIGFFLGTFLPFVPFSSGQPA